MAELSEQATARQEGAEDRDVETEPRWYTGWRGPLIVGIYVLLTVAAITVSTRELSFATWLVGLYQLVAGWIQTAVSLSSGNPTGSPRTPAWLLGLSEGPSLQTTIPMDVYLFGLAGAFTRFLLSFVTDMASLTAQGPLEGGEEGDGSETGDGSSEGMIGDEASATELQLLHHVLGIPAAVYLAAGVYLVGTQVAGLLQRFDAQVVFAIFSFLVGFYVKRAYGLLGDVADRLLEPVEDDEAEPQGSMFARTFNLSTPTTATADTPGSASEAGGEAPGSEVGSRKPARPWYTGWRGMLLFGITVLIAFGTLIAILEEGPVADVCGAAPCFRIPADVYLYSFMGGVGYVFTKLFVDVKRSRRSIIESSIRIFAGVFLAVGIYLLFNPTTGAVSAVAFLVGLYLNVAVVRFDAFAEKIFARLSQAITKSATTEEKSARRE